ncbi:hypothetical protein [Vampirovibrio chlorellavorus]|uniref:hypothetical protein n=1 Tax=Vampirovibrio chlorellavorus TaxID=758823 RepID=UPI0026E9553F|nr:hypothetical protein [Vampirovibrio chlorellavorus]
MPTGEQVLIVSFNDTEAVNSRLRQSALTLNAKFEILKDLSDQLQTEASYSANRFWKKWRGHFTSAYHLKKVTVNASYRDLLLRQAVACHRLLTEKAVDLVVVCEDGPGGCGPLIAAAKRCDIQVIEMPFGIGEMRDYDIFIENKARENALNRVPDNENGAFLRAHAQHWIKSTPYGDITLLPTEFVLARLATGMDLPVPWAVHGGVADVLLVESEAMERIYKREQVPAAKRIMTGSCYADAVYDELTGNPALQTAYEKASFIDPEKPAILVALPPSYHQEYPGKSEFSTYREAIATLFAGCRAAHPKARITVSVHPAVKNSDLEMIRTLADEVTDEWLIRLIPKCDVFVSVFSSTIRWGLMCGKPIVNYDMYRFELPTYDTAICVFTTPVLQEAMTRLNAILASEAAYHEAALQVKACGPEWGMMDGRNFDRIWTVLQEQRKQPDTRPTWLRWLKRRGKIPASANNG